MLSRSRGNDPGILGDTDAPMRGYYTEAENARDKLSIIFNHLNVGTCEIIHPGLADLCAVGRRENELLVSAWIVLDAASTGASAQSG